MQEFDSKESDTRTSYLYSQESESHTHSERSHIHLQKLGKNAWAHTLYEHAGHV